MKQKLTEVVKNNLVFIVTSLALAAVFLNQAFRNFLLNQIPYLSFFEGLQLVASVYFGTVVFTHTAKKICSFALVESAEENKSFAAFDADEIALIFGFSISLLLSSFSLDIPVSSIAAEMVIVTGLFVLFSAMINSILVVIDADEYLKNEEDGSVEE
jgi:hypothetical protein